jgi:transcription initiation factor TFIIH subunit 1
MGEVRAAQDGRSRKVNFTLSKEQIAQIFAEHPAVRAAYMSHVPGKLSDLEFWTKYCRVQYFRAARKGGAAENEAEAADAALFAPDEGALAEEAAARVHRVDPRLNLAAAAADGLSEEHGRGTAHGGARERDADAAAATKGSVMAAVIRDINRHAEVVLDGVPDALPEDRAALAAAAAARAAAVRAEAARVAAEGHAGARGRRRGEQGAGATAAEEEEDGEAIADLRAPNAARPQELRIQDPRRYFDAASATGGAGGAAAAGAAPGAPAGSRAVLPPSLSAQAAPLGERPSADARALPPALALRVLSDLGHAAATARANGLGGGAGGGDAAAVPQALTGEFRDAARASRELLRHFWACYPLEGAGRAAREAKCGRVRDALARIYDDLSSKKDALPSAGRHAAGQQLRPLLAALDAAFEHADADAARRGEQQTQRAQPQPLAMEID